MISSFRKELKKWTAVLWVLFASMLLGSLSILIFRQPGPREIKVALVNSDPIFLNEYKQSITLLQSQIDMLANYARAQGISPEFFLAMTGLKNPEEAAFKELVNEKLMLSIIKNLSLEVDSTSLNEEVSKMLPAQLFDQNGKLNEKAYREYLGRLQLTIPEFETKKENDLKQNFISTVVKESAYVPAALINEHEKLKNLKKRFAILSLPFTRFDNEVRKQGAQDDELQELYNATKEVYRIPEKRKAVYCTIPLDKYYSKVSVDDDAIELFYEKNKSSMYRVPPEVAVRVLSVPIENIASPASIMNAHKKAEELYSEAIKEPKQFESFVKKHAVLDTEKKSAGFIGLFKRGTHSAEFEKEAFKLKDVLEFSKPIRVENRFEIVQLLDRKAATYIPLSMVRDEIAKRLRENKALNTLKSDLEAVMHASREDEKAFNHFVEQEKLKMSETAFLANDRSAENELMNHIAQKLFAKKKSALNFGYFTHNKEYVLYKEIDRTTSKIPSFAAVKSEVEKAYFAKKSKEHQKAVIASTRLKLLEGAATLEQISKEHDGHITKTSFVRHNDTNETIFKDEPSLLSKSFALSDPRQVLKFKGKNAYYLVTLEGVENDKKDNSKTEQFTFFEKALESKKMLTFNAFIASLQRHARIERYEKIPQYHPVSVTEDIL